MTHATVAQPSTGELLERLRAQVAAKEARFRQGHYPVHPDLAGLLPGAGLKPGAAYSLFAGCGALLLALLAEPSRAGHWCGVVGMPEFGAEAAGLAGVCLDRLALVPEPGEQWLGITAALAEALPVVAVRPSGRVSEADAARLMSRLRDREAVLLVAGPWPRAEASLTATQPRWWGVGDGYGHLERREVTVTATSRRLPVPRSVRIVLPAPDGRLARPAAPAPV
ncbi:MAG: hypothetical protein IT193_00145, partial [Propionibacteriaceae bacterium]|nr:hypothetical protein [Propionibacteriaceae bacterium]